MDPDNPWKLTKLKSIEEGEWGMWAPFTEPAYKMMMGMWKLGQTA